MSCPVLRLDSYREILADVNRRIKSSHAIASRITDMPPTHTKEALEERIKVIGWRRFVEFETQQLERGRNFEAVKAVAQLTDDHSIRSLAMGVSGIGDCQEMAFAALAEVVKQGPALLVVIRNDSDSANHSFVVSCQKDDEVKTAIHMKVPLEDWFKRLPDTAVVLDPFLNRAFSIKTPDPDFLAYNRIWGLRQIDMVAGYAQNSPVLQQAMHRAREVYKEMVEKLPSIEPTGPLADIMADYSRECCAILKDVFPGTEWKFSLKKGTNIFTRCSLEKATEISDHLREKGILFTQGKVKKQKETDPTLFAIILNGANPNELKHL